MELLLNLAWLLLALPAYWLWCGSRYASAGRKLTSVQRLFSLACMLVILFPVISATDDLRVMRAEMEESPSTKRSICQKTAERASTGKWHSQPSLVSLPGSFFRWGEISLLALIIKISIPSAPAIAPSGRAPPQLFFA
jgi:hypothetical protein